MTFNVASEAGRAQQDALEGVARVIDEDLTAAYDNANGSQDAFIASATQIGTETLARLQTELGLTDAQVETLGTTLGLTAADYEARFELAGAAEAQLQLSLLQGAIEGLPPEVETRVNTLITQGDYVAARDEIAAFYAANPATVTTEVDPEGAQTGIAEITDADHPTTITADADTITAAADLLDTASETRTAVIAASALTTAARLDLNAVANEERTAEIDIITGSINLPSAFELSNRIGTIRVPIQAFWNTRIEGNRPI